MASRIGAHADAARAEARRLDATVARLRWDGTAAAAFLLLAGDVIAGLRTSADRLDDAADALRRHAANVAAALESLVRGATDAVCLGGGLLHGITDEVLHPSRLIGDGLQVLDDTAHVAHDIGGVVGVG
jgi:hypothetical protein